MGNESKLFSSHSGHQERKPAVLTNTSCRSCCMGSRQRGAEPPWIFIHGADKEERGLIVLFFGFVFSVAPLSWKFFCRRPCCAGLQVWSDNTVFLTGQSLVGQKRGDKIFIFWHLLFGQKLCYFVFPCKSFLETYFLNKGELTVYWNLCFYLFEKRSEAATKTFQTL